MSDEEYERELSAIETNLIRLAAGLVTPRHMPSPYEEDLQFCATTPAKDRRRRAEGNAEWVEWARHNGVAARRIADQIQGLRDTIAP